MAVKIRLSRGGNRNRPFYRVNAIDERAKRDGRVIEQLGSYDPLFNKGEGKLDVKLDRCAYWISVGAQPSETVSRLLAKQGLTSKSGTPIEQQSALASNEA